MVEMAEKASFINLLYTLLTIKWRNNNKFLLWGSNTIASLSQIGNSDTKTWPSQ